MYHVGPFLPGGGVVGLLLFAALVLIVAWGIATLFKREHHHVDSHVSQQPPLSVPTAQPLADAATQILRERFARGEISETEFLSASRALATPLTPPTPPAGPPGGQPA